MTYFNSTLSSYCQLSHHHARILLLASQICANTSIVIYYLKIYNQIKQEQEKSAAAAPLMFYIVILFLTACTTLVSAETYDNSTLPYQLYVLHQIDTYVYLVLCPICLFFITLILVSFFLQPSSRQMPGDIMLALTIMDAILLSHWFSTSVYNVVYPPSNYQDDTIPPGFNSFCQIQSLMDIVGNSGEFVYNCIFCIFLLVQTNVGIKRSTKISLRGIVYHGISIFLILLMVTLGYSTHQTGMNLYGMCSYKYTQVTAYLSVSLVLIYICLSTYTIFYFKKQIPNQPAFRKYREKFLVYYFQYILCTVIVWGILSICNFLITLNVTLEDPLRSLEVFATIGNMAKLSNPIVLTVIRYRNPVIKPTMDLILSRIFCCSKPGKKDSDYFTSDTSRNSGSQDVYSRAPDDLIQETKTKKSNSELQMMDWFSCITDSLRRAQIYTLIVGLNKSFNERRALQQQGLVRVQLDSYLQQRISILTDLDNPESLKKKTKISVIEMKMTVYAPAIFGEYLRQDGLTYDDIIESLDISKNKNNMRDSCNDGGKSGEFFMFTYDNRFLLKTMTEEEVEIYIKNASHFYRYHTQVNPQSLITKFYGIFTFESLNQSMPKIHLLVTRNICLTPQSRVMSVYDMKGSRFNREVLKRQTMSFHVLKDVDFQNIERRIYVSEDTARQYRRVLEKDAKFFFSVGIIDYSLIIIKVLLKESDANLPEKIGSSRSTSDKDKEDRVFYQIGIIDYLQLWDNFKRLEMTAKRLINRDPKLDTSAQNPDKYCKRFISNLVMKIFMAPQ